MGQFNGKFVSAKQDWETPQGLFDVLNERYHFTFDLAASSENRKCQQFFCEQDDALGKTWIGVCWLNPPYGDAKSGKLSDWVKKAYMESLKPDCITVMLIPARTNTKWWHRYCMKAREVLLVEGRPKFGDAKHGLPQPLAVVVFNGESGETFFGSLPSR